MESNPPSSRAAFDKPPEYSPAAPIKVFVVGETQQGKSTLIKQVGKFAGNAALDIEIGNGSLSCTKSVGEYNLHVTPRAYQLVDDEGNPIVENDFQGLMDLTNSDAEVVEIPEPDIPSIEYHFIDTPGLGDSNDDDLTNMAHTLGQASELGYINALVYVRNIEESYSRSFQQFFSYLQRCFHTFSQGFIIVHTNFTTRKVNEFLEDRADLASIRREAFQKTMNMSLEHFFMDNSPNRFSPFARLQSTNEMCRFLRHLAAQRSMPCSGFRLLKTPSMRHIDVHVKNALNELKISLDREKRKEENIGDMFMQGSMFHQLEISRLKTKILLTNAKIDDLRTGPDVLLGTKSCSEDYAIWGNLFGKAQVYLGERRMEFVSDHDITSVTKSSRGCRWKDEFRQGGTWRGTIASGAFRDINGTVTFYTTSASRNRDTIKLLEGIVQEMEEGIATHESSLNIRGHSVVFNENAVKIGRDLEKVDSVLQAVSNEEFGMSLWPALKVLYRSQSGLSRQEIIGFVRAYDEDVALLL